MRKNTTTLSVLRGFLKNEDSYAISCIMNVMAHINIRSSQTGVEKNDNCKCPGHLEEHHYFNQTLYKWVTALIKNTTLMWKLPDGRMGAVSLVHSIGNIAHETTTKSEVSMKTLFLTLSVLFIFASCKNNPTQSNQMKEEPTNKKFWPWVLGNSWTFHKTWYCPSTP